MSAKRTDDGRVGEIYRVIKETEARIAGLGLTERLFLEDDSVQGRNAVDGIFMCVYRVTEEAGNISAETKAEYPEIPWRAVYGMRNIVAHDYGKLDRQVVWDAATADFAVLKRFCLSYAKDHGLEL